MEVGVLRRACDINVSYYHCRCVSCAPQLNCLVVDIEHDVSCVRYHDCQQTPNPAPQSGGGNTAVIILIVLICVAFVCCAVCICCRRQIGERAPLLVAPRRWF